MKRNLWHSPKSQIILTSCSNEFEYIFLLFYLLFNKLDLLEAASGHLRLIYLLA